MTAAVLPIAPARILAGFSTSPVAQPPFARVAFADAALGVHKVTSRTTHNIVTPPDPFADAAHTSAWEAVFAQGSIAPGNSDAPPGGFGFYARGPPPFADALAAQRAQQEVVLGYEVLFEPGWAWQRGGKLPGIYGGVGESAYGCTGGRKSDRCRCFNLRLMWREGGAGELYAYVPLNDANTRALEAVPGSRRNPDYGFSVGRGAWRFEPGRWTAVAQRVKMNTPGQADGEIEVYIDGRTVIRATGLMLRDADVPESGVQGMHFQTFFGGHTPEWASPKEQRAWFTNVSGAVLKPAQAHDEL